VYTINIALDNFANIFAVSEAVLAREGTSLLTISGNVEIYCLFIIPLFLF